MKTVTIQIGNSDNKLSQAAWAAFIILINQAINKFSPEIHFHGGSNFNESWQNCAWVFDLSPEQTKELQTEVEIIRRHYQQGSVAWTCGETEFI